MVGAMSIFVAVNSSAMAQLNPVLSYVLGKAPFYSVRYGGLVVWREFQGSGFRPKLLHTGKFLFFGAGLAAVALAPAYAR